MSVYVDRAENPFGRMKMCHMVADSIQELHEFAALIGLRPEWFQPLSSPHYDLSKSKRAEAVRNGAIEVDRRGIVEVIRRQRPSWLAETRSAGAGST